MAAREFKLSYDIPNLRRRSRFDTLTHRRSRGIVSRKTYLPVGLVDRREGNQWDQEARVRARRTADEDDARRSPPSAMLAISSAASSGDSRPPLRNHRGSHRIMPAMLNAATVGSMSRRRPVFLSSTIVSRRRSM